ncbi:MAG: NADPH:quinone oxidoreductase family protein, partial [Pseudomonadota bacterium]
MKALLCKDYGPPESLVYTDAPSPKPSAGEVLIRVKACGVNFPDLLLIENKYQFRPERPFSPGGEVAGEITALGAGVTNVAVGDRVIAMIGSRGFQEETLAQAERCMPIPESMDYEVAASFTLTYGTSYHALVDRANLRPGETVLVLGASGGVGSAALDIARNLGARTIAVGSSDQKLARVKDAYDVDEIVNLTTIDGSLKDRVNELTDGKGADVIYDPVGGDPFQQALRCVGWNGRILVVGFAADGDNLPQARTNLLLLKGSALIGVFWGRFTTEEPEKSAANFDVLFDWHARQKLSPIISHRFELVDGVAALNALVNRE